MITRSCGSTIITTHRAPLAHSLAVFAVTVVLVLALASPTAGRAQDRQIAGGTAGKAVAAKQHHHHKLIERPIQIARTDAHGRRTLHLRDASMDSTLITDT
jgi:hypothetical protein